MDYKVLESQPLGQLPDLIAEHMPSRVDEIFEESYETLRTDVRRGRADFRTLGRFNAIQGKIRDEIRALAEIMRGVINTHYSDRREELLEVSAVHSLWLIVAGIALRKCTGSVSTLCNAFTIDPEGANFAEDIRIVIGEALCIDHH